jgi:catechol 2,3-dioxygenase-like lactoylglutathione lyase family enzyme
MAGPVEVTGLGAMSRSVAGLTVGDRTVTRVDYRLELVIVPVTDVDRAKAFYVEKAGFRADFDAEPGGGIRFVQLTPPGSACSIAFGTGLTSAVPGSIEVLQLVVDDADAARADLMSRGLDVGDVQDLAWGRFVYFSDPDGNKWAVQQVPDRSGAPG